MASFRMGQWIKDGRGVGIFWRGTGPFLGRDMHLVDMDTGETTDIVAVQVGVTVPVTDVAELPLSRCAHLDRNFNPATKRYKLPDGSEITRDEWEKRKAEA